MMDRLLKRIPLAMSNNNNNNSSSSFVSPPPPLALGAVNPLDSARRQLATLEPTVKALLEMKNPALAIVREKLETMEAIIVAFPEELEPVEAAIWRAKMATWWVEYSKQQTAALFPGLEGEKDKDQQQQQQQKSHDLAPVFFPKPSVADSETDHLASFGGGGAIRRFRSFANERNQAKNLPVTTTTANSSMMAVEDGSTAESSDGEEPDLKRPTLAQSSSSSSAVAAAAFSAEKMLSVADPDSRLIDAGDSKEAGLKAIQFFSKGR